MLFILLLAWGMLIGFPFYGYKRGTGSALWLLLCILASEILIITLAPIFAHTNSAHSEAQTLLGQWQLWLFLPLLLLSFPISTFLARILDLNLDPFDWLFGATLGLVAGIMAVRLLLSALLLATEDQAIYPLLDQALLTRQIVYLDGWHNLVKWITTLHNPKPVVIPE